MKPVLVDTSFLVALYNRSDSHHQRCLQVHLSLTQRLVTCEAVLAESLYLLSAAKGAGAAVLANVERGALEIPFVLAKSAGMVRQVMEKYADLPADFADACLVQMADELGTGDILTLDSDFRHYRWRKTRAFRMLIPLE